MVQVLFHMRVLWVDSFGVIVRGAKLPFRSYSCTRRSFDAFSFDPVSREHTILSGPSGDHTFSYSAVINDRYIWTYSNFNGVRFEVYDTATDTWKTVDDELKPIEILERFTVGRKDLICKGLVAVGHHLLIFNQNRGANSRYVSVLNAYTMTFPIDMQLQPCPYHTANVMTY
jgi:hypothetical protein